MLQCAECLRVHGAPGCNATHTTEADEPSCVWHLDGLPCRVQQRAARGKTPDVTRPTNEDNSGKTADEPQNEVKSMLSTEISAPKKKFRSRYRRTPVQAPRMRKQAQRRERRRTLRATRPMDGAQQRACGRSRHRREGERQDQRERSRRVPRGSAGSAYPGLSCHGEGQDRHTLAKREALTFAIACEDIVAVVRFISPYNRI